jgi:hypothetical protein
MQTAPAVDAMRETVGRIPIAAWKIAARPNLKRTIMANIYSGKSRVFYAS